MALKVDNIEKIMLTNQSTGNLLTLMNSMLKDMIDNDNSLVIENSQSPKIWECKWMNDDSIEGYPKGYSVWLNTETDTEILNFKRSEISTYIENNGILSEKFEKINKSDNTQVNKFFKDVINGEVSFKVPKLYYLGKITDRVQIKVLSVDVPGGCKDYPNTSAWADFYIQNTREDNINLMYEKLSSILSVEIGRHEDEYHISVSNNKELTSLLSSFLPRDNFRETSLNKIEKQYFYDHRYCRELSGFDYVKDFKQEGSNWYRLWNSGYLEQGGYVQNYGDALLNASFMIEYDYQSGSTFYQQGYDSFMDIPIKCSIAPGSRYCVTVTPQRKTSSDGPYNTNAKNYDGVKVYTSVDVTKMSNDGFLIINTDTNQDFYDGYVFYTCGYTTKTIKEVKQQEKSGVYKVNFIDTHG